MKDCFDYSEMQDWLVEDLQSRGIHKPSQILFMTEEQVRVNRILPLGTLKNVSIYFEKRNVFFKNGENSIYRLHLQKRGLWVLINNGITELSDLEGYSLDDVAEVLGFGWERAGYISKQMGRWGYKLKWV